MLIQGDAAAIPLSDKSVHCVVTSPPYYGLRKYSGEQQRVWGGDADCEHVWREAPPRRSRHPEDIKNPESKQSTSKGSSPELPHTQICQLCGAWYGGLGLEPTPELYIEHIVEIFGEVWRVLRDDGVVWVNMGDSFQGENIRADDVAPFSEVDASWLAALIDSDGCITIARNKRSNNKTISYHALVSVTQTKKQMVNRAHGLCGGATLSEKRPGRERTFFRWYLAGQQAAPILRAIYPYLMLKQTQAALAIMLCEHVKEKKFHRSNPITQEAMEYREALKESVRRLNALKPTVIEPKRPRLYKHGMAQGNLLLMPHKVALALQANGWIVRNDVVWSKANPMPEPLAGWRWERKSCDCGKDEREKAIAEAMEEQGTDRHRLKGLLGYDWPHDKNCPKCHGTGKVGDPVLRQGSWRHTRAHEYIFQLVKSMRYYSNQEAVREKQSELTLSYAKRQGYNRTTTGPKGDDGTKPGAVTGRKFDVGGRNPRSVLDVPTQSYRGAHYATYPEKLIAPLIRASCPKRCCPACGAPYAPVVEKERPPAELYTKNRNVDESISRLHRGEDGTKVGHGQKVQDWLNEHPPVIKDYRPTCSCECGDHIPGICLDPFIGSGTTGAVARELGRRWVGLDISMEYLDQQAKPRALNLTPKDALDDLPMFAQGGER